MCTLYRCSSENTMYSRYNCMCLYMHISIHGCIYVCMYVCMIYIILVQDGDTPLHLAIRQDSADTAADLVRIGADVTALNKV